MERVAKKNNINLEEDAEELMTGIQAKRKQTLDFYKLYNVKNMIWFRTSDPRSLQL